MRKLFSAVNISLDDFADHTISVPDAELLDFFTAQFDRIGAVLFGRVTYQLFVEYWPHAEEDPASTPSMLAYARKINSIPKVVFSRTLRRVDWNNTRLVKGDPLAEVAKMKQGTGKDLLVGGLSLLQAFTRAGLMDEYWLLIHPLVVGKGRPYFDGLQGRVDLRLAGTQTFHSGVVGLHYILDSQNEKK